MTGFQILREILGQAWAIHESQLQAFQAIIPSLRQGSPVDFGSIANPSAFEKDDRGPSLEDRYIHYVSGPRNPQPGGAQQYVGVIEFRGTVMKQDYCGSVGTQTLGKWIQNLDNDPNVMGIVLSLDSPGGSVAGTEDVSKIISQTTKPIVAFVDGMAASAAYWMASQTEHIMVSGSTDVLGSIGTMFAMLDLIPAYEKEGAVYYELYASQSTEKNGAFRLMEKGKNEAMVARLTQYQSVFESAVISGRGEKLNKEKTLAGQDYLSAEALEYGLADSTGTLQDAVNLAADLAATGKSKSDRTNMSLFSKSLPTAIKALAGQAPSAVTEEALTAANAALEAENIKGFELVKVEDVTSLQAAHDTLATANVDLTKQLADIKADADKAKADLATATKRAEEAEAKAEEFGGQPGAKPANPASKKESEAVAESNTVPSYFSEADRIAAEADKENETVDTLV